MAEAIDPLELRIAQLLGDEETAEIKQPVLSQISPDVKITTSSNPFDDILSKAVEALDGISRTEARANELIDQYIQGQADLQDVMIATSKASVMVQMAVTTINLAVNTFKEITQMQV